MVGPEYKPFVWKRPPFAFVSTIHRQGRCVPSKTIIFAKTLPFLLDSITVVYLQFNGKSNDLPYDVRFNSHFDSWESPFRKPQGDGQHSNSWPGHGMTSFRTRNSERRVLHLIFIAAGRRSFVCTGVEPMYSSITLFPVILFIYRRNGRGVERSHFSSGPVMTV